jgi:SAM-dependent methyltransferase
VQHRDRPVSRSRYGARNLRDSWEQHAAAWVEWARRPEHDSYWKFHRELFLELLPVPGVGTLDLGCGEGRLSRDLKALGHRVVGVDASPAMVAAAKETDPEIEVHVADAAALPFQDAMFDCVVAHLSLQDVDDLPGAIREVSRVLKPHGRFCAALIHPFNSAADPRDEGPEPPLVISGSYLGTSYYEDNVIRDGLEMTFVSAHRPIAVYADAITDAGMLIERVREPAVPEDAIRSPEGRFWQRFPLFLHLRALKPSDARDRAGQET